jgi:DNA-binding transcriptional LysR family regulator
MTYDLTDLRLFAAVANARNLTHGAARANLAPSSASHRLKLLEQDLGAPLFERHARGLNLTRAGEALLRHTRQVFGQLEQMHADLAPYASGVRAQVTICANTNATSSFLPDDLGAFLRLQPHVRVSLRESTSPAAMRAVAAGEADIGVCAGEPGEAELELRPYRRDRWLLALPPAHPLARRKKLRLRDVLDQPFICLPSGSGAHGFLTAKAADLGRHLDVRVQVGSIDSILRMVAAGAGLGFVPQSAFGAPGTPRVARVPLDETWADRDLVIVTRRDAPLAPTARALVEHLAACGNAALCRPRRTSR